MTPPQLGTKECSGDYRFVSQASHLLTCGKGPFVLAQGPVLCGGKGTGHYGLSGIPSTFACLPSAVEFGCTLEE